MSSVIVIVTDLMNEMVINATQWSADAVEKEGAQVAARCADEGSREGGRGDGQVVFECSDKFKIRITKSFESFTYLRVRFKIGA